jgi:hypothetical protein
MSYRGLGVTGLTEEILDTLVLAVSAIGDQGVNSRFSDPVAVALAVRAGVALSVDLFGSSARALHLTPRHRRSDWLSNAWLCTTVRTIVGSTRAQGTWKPGLGERSGLFRAV